MYTSIIASSITIGFGGSVGAEAPIVLTGSAIGSNLGSFSNWINEISCSWWDAEPQAPLQEF